MNKSIKDNSKEVKHSMGYKEMKKKNLVLVKHKW